MDLYQKPSLIQEVEPISYLFTGEHLTYSV